MSYLGNSPTTVTEVDYLFTATEGQTVFSGNDIDGKILAFTIGNVDVFVNGSLLTTDDYSQSTGTITLNSGRTLTDAVLVRAKGTYSSTDHYTKAESVPKAGGEFTGDVKFATINGGSLSGFKNRLMNPLFQVDIEGNAGGVSTSGKHIVEGWTSNHSTDVTTLTASRVVGTTVPYALKYTVTTGSDTSIVAGQYALILSAIEGYDIADALWGTANAKSIWISGSVKAPTTGVYCVSVRNSAGDRSYVFEVECVAGTYVNFEKEIPGDTSGTWNSTNGIGLSIGFSMAMGSTYHTTADTWSTGSFHSTSNQANGLATNGNIYEIENIRVSVGGPIPTEYRPFALDLAHCQRYYETSYNIGTAPSTATFTGCILAFLGGTSRYRSNIVAKVQKRSTPTLTIYSPYNGSSGFIYNASTTTNQAASAIYSGENCFAVQGTESVVTTDAMVLHYVMNNRLI